MSGLHQQIERAGFFRRALAFAIDSLIVSLLSSAVLLMIVGGEGFANLQRASAFNWQLLAYEQLIPALWAIGFWIWWMATPGKLLLDCQIVDAKTLQRASVRQLLLRYLGYLVSSIPLGLGFLWILFDKQKQGWHDKIASTLVIMQDESRQVSLQQI